MDTNNSACYCNVRLQHDTSGHDLPIMYVTVRYHLMLTDESKLLKECSIVILYKLMLQTFTQLTINT